MLISEKVIQRWNSKNKNYYLSKGYTYTQMRDTFEVDVNDLPNGSTLTVEVICDYCGKIYTKRWYNYILENSEGNIHSDCCYTCKHKKAHESVVEKYNVDNVMKLETSKDKFKDTCLKKYNTINPFASPEIKSKIIQTNIEKYGCESPMQNPIIQKHASDTCYEKYGVRYYIETQCFTGEKNPRWKGGVHYHRNERATKEYITWRKAVYSRDQYTCQCCGGKSSVGVSVNLNAHHIKNWKDYVDLRYEVNNGITLCDKCHNMFHSIFGKSMNDEVELNYFLDNYGKKVC